MYISNSIWKIHTDATASETERSLTQYNNWFYVFQFTNGVSTLAPNQLTNIIHQTRADLIFPFLDQYLDNKWDNVNCLDIACNQGWFTTQVGLRGAKSVIGFDIRADHLAYASTIKSLANLENVTYSKLNLFDVIDDHLGRFEITFFLGLLYHLENPMGALRKVRSLTKKICVIETQVAKAASDLEMLNGSDLNIKRGSGIGVFPSDDTHAEGGVSVVLVPTLNALYQMLYAVGFDRVYLAVPPKNMYVQYPDFDRVILFAQVLND